MKLNPKRIYLNPGINNIIPERNDPGPGTVDVNEIFNKAFQRPSQSAGGYGTVAAAREIKNRFVSWQDF